jgi:hypothetical protein
MTLHLRRTRAFALSSAAAAASGFRRHRRSFQTSAAWVPAPRGARDVALALGLLAISLAAAAWFQESDLLLAVAVFYLSMLASSLQAATIHTLNGAR